LAELAGGLADLTVAARGARAYIQRMQNEPKRTPLWLIALLLFIFVAVPLWGIWGAYQSIRDWQGCEVVGTATGYGYQCKDGRKYP